MAAAFLVAVRGAPPAPGPSLAPVERLKRERLAAARADVEALAGQRRPMPVSPPWMDFRCIFHAHASDSVHTGGTLDEMLADAQRAGVHAIFLSDHHRPPRDFMDSWRGVRGGVLFVPGSEARGFLIHPERSVAALMEGPVDRLLEAAGAGQGMVFLSHLEERPGHPMTGLVGLEIYNRHYDAKRDLAGLVALAMRLTDPSELADFETLVRDYPDEILAAQVTYPALYLDRWDEALKHGRATGIAANDCHHNQVFVARVVDADTVRLGTAVDREDQMRIVRAAERPGIRRMTSGRKPGDILARVDLDPYYRSFRNVSTHVLAGGLGEEPLRRSVREGRVYVAHEWMGDPTGVRLVVGVPGKAEVSAAPGDTVPLVEGLRLALEMPLPGLIRFVKDGVVVGEMAGGRRCELHPRDPGAYRAEGWLQVGGEWRPWIYMNPIHLGRPSGG